MFEARLARLAPGSPCWRRSTADELSRGRRLIT
jgi:hypothetical protein